MLFLYIKEHVNNNKFGVPVSNIIKIADNMLLKM